MSCELLDANAGGWKPVLCKTVIHQHHDAVCRKRSRRKEKGREYCQQAQKPTNNH
jgi:hypothetical protein